MCHDLNKDYMNDCNVKYLKSEMKENPYRYMKDLEKKFDASNYEMSNLDEVVYTNNSRVISDPNAYTENIGMKKSLRAKLGKNMAHFTAN